MFTLHEYGLVSSYGHWSHQTLYKLSSPLAADVVGDDDLELILGNMIYDVEINNKEGRESNSITLVKSITPPSGVVDDGNVQVADFNLDGNLDVFISVRNVAEVRFSRAATAHTGFMTITDAISSATRESCIWKRLWTF